MDKKINPSPITYLNSGVDIDAGNTLVEAIKPHAKKRNGVTQNDSRIGRGKLPKTRYKARES